MIKELLDEKKAMDIMEYDLKDSDYFVDYVIIATTLGPKHSNALLDHLLDYIPKKDIIGIDRSDEWIVLDLGDKLIHLMSQEYRAKYQLDEFLKKMRS